MMLPISGEGAHEQACRDYLEVPVESVFAFIEEFHHQESVVDTFFRET